MRSSPAFPLSAVDATPYGLNLMPSPPQIVAAWPEMGWISIDETVWFSANILDQVAPLSDVLGVHLDPATGLQCKRAPASISAHTVVSRDPLTLSPSLACSACSWHGFVQGGHWVPA